MEQSASMMTTPSDKPGKTAGKGLKIAVAITSVVAVCGIGLGAYGMVQNLQKDEQIAELKTQIENSDASDTETIATENESATKKETSSTGSSTASATKTSGGPYIESGYFYVPKWGVKYKLSSSLTNYGYAVDQESQGDSYGDYVVGLTAIAKSDYVSQPQSDYYNDIFSCSVVTVRAIEDSKKDYWSGVDVTPDVQFNGLDFVIHDIWRTEDCTSDHMAPTEAAAKQLKTILSSPEKI